MIQLQVIFLLCMQGVAQGISTSAHQNMTAAPLQVAEADQMYSARYSIEQHGKHCSRGIAHSLQMLANVFIDWVGLDNDHFVFMNQLEQDVSGHH